MPTCSIFYVNHPLQIEVRKMFHRISILFQLSYSRARTIIIIRVLRAVSDAPLLEMAPIKYFPNTYRQCITLCQRSPCIRASFECSLSNAFTGVTVLLTHYFITTIRLGLQSIGKRRSKNDRPGQKGLEVGRSRFANKIPGPCRCNTATGRFA